MLTANIQVNLDRGISAQVTAAALQIIMAEVTGNFVGGSDVPCYDGPCEVTPKTNTNQILRTANLLVEENITVLKIPVYEVSNSAGTTVIIGGE